MVKPSPSEIVEFPSPGKLPTRAASKLDPEFNPTDKPSGNPELFTWLCDRFAEGRDASEDWRKEATEDFGFAAGWQYDSKDMEIARTQKRPLITFDRVGRNVAAVSGLEINNRARAAAYPREVGDVEESDIGSSTLAWVEDETDSATEKSDAFRDLVTCGIGVTDTVMDYLMYDGGMPAEVRLSPLICYWDPYAKRRNLIDRSWDAIAKTVPIAEARRLAGPDHDDVMLHASWAAVDDDLENAGLHVDNKRYETHGRGRNDSDKQRARVTLIEIQWREIEQGFLIEDLDTGEQKEVSPMVGRAMVESLPHRFSGMEQPRYVYWRALLGGQILKKWRLDDQKGFTREYMTGYRDETRGSWFGLVRTMKDPQRAANALYSQSVAMMKSGTKNGFVMERTAVKDIRRFERDQARNGANLIVDDGAITGGKIQPITPSPPPAHTHELLAMSLQQVQESVGIPIEMVAAATGHGAGQTALLESERRKAGMNILANFFAAKRVHLQRQARLVLRYVAAFMSDGRLMRVVNEGQTKYVPLIFDEDVSRFDIIVDESPTSPDQRERTWLLLRELLPEMRAMGMPPKMMLELLPYIPNMPSALISKLSEQIEEMSAQTEEQQRQAQLAARAQEAEVAKIEGQAVKEKSAADLNYAKIQDMGGRLTLDATEQARETSLAIAQPGVTPFREFG